MISRYFSHPLRKYDPYKGDSQAHKVYNMEKEIIGWSVDTAVPKRKLRQMTRYVCKKFGVRPPHVAVLNLGARKPFGWCEFDRIVLNRDWHGDNYPTLLHELAHWIDGEKNNAEGEAHGPVFVGIYREILDRFRFLPKDCFDLLAERHGVEYVEYTSRSPSGQGRTKGS